MSALFTRPTAAVFIEFAENVAHIVGEARSVDIPIERGANGAVTPASGGAIGEALRPFANKPGAQVFCLLPARGVSIRRISLPAASRDEIDRLLPLQIEAHFPLSAEELSWGYSILPGSAPSRNGAPLKELLVAAVKKETLQQYRNIIASAGFTPLFSIAALTREGICAQRLPKFALLEIGGQQSELLTFDESGPVTLRVVPLGAESSTSTEPLLNTLRSNGAIEKLFVTGKASTIWSARINPNIPSETIAVAPGHSSAIHGLRETLRRGHDPLLIHATREAVKVQRAQAPWRWAAAAVVLLLVSIGLRYAEPMIRANRLNATISELRAAREKLPSVNREASFLQYIHTNQPTYLEAVAALGSSAQSGTKLESLSISRKGDISMRGSAQNGQAAASLRSKMIDSGMFANVVLDEQTPVQNQQQVNFRMTAQLRSPGDRKPAASATSTNKPPARAGATSAPPTSVTKTNPPTAP